MKLLIKLAFAALMVNAGYRIGSEYLTHIQFRDGIRDAATYKTTNDDDLRRKVMELSVAHEVPLTEDQFKIVREDRHVVVQGRYEKPIEVVPTVRYQWPFSWTIDAMVSTTYPLVPPRR
jgi:hypothetical protein